MPLGRTYMYNFGSCISKGCDCMYALSHFHRRWWFWTSLGYTHLCCTIVSLVYQWILTMIVPLERERMERSREINRPGLGFMQFLTWGTHPQWDRPILVYWTRWREPCKINYPSLGFCRVPSLQTSCKWPRLHRPYQMLVVNVDSLNKISSNTPWGGMHWLLLLLPGRA